jgi:hypothetical protein
MSELLVKVGKSGEFFCQMGAHKVTTGRAYDFQLWTEDDRGGWHWSTATICAACRGHFMQADLEADAPDMERDYFARHPEDAIRDQMAERMAESEDAGSRWLDPVSRHLTFPADRS